MKEKIINTLGFNDLPYQVPATVEEFDTLAGKIGACLEEAVNNVVYRIVLADFRSGFLHGFHIGEGDEAIEITGVEEITGIKRREKESGRVDSETKEPIMVYDETESDYWKRVCIDVAKQNTEQNNDGPKTPEAVALSFRPVALEVLAAIEFNPRRKEKLQAGPKKIAKTYLAVAQKLVDAGNGAATAAKLASKLGIEVQATVESIARAIAEDKRRQKAKEDLMAEYA